MNFAVAKNKQYYHLLLKLITLCLLSTTVGPEHEPLLPLGVVNPQQASSHTESSSHTDSFITESSDHCEAMYELCWGKE